MQTCTIKTPKSQIICVSTSKQSHSTPKIYMRDSQSIRASAVPIISKTCTVIISLIIRLLHFMRCSQRTAPRERFLETAYSGVSMTVPVHNTSHGDTTVEMIDERADNQSLHMVNQPHLFVGPTCNSKGCDAISGGVCPFLGPSPPRSESYAFDTTSTSSPSRQSLSLSLHEESSGLVATNAHDAGTEWVVIDLNDPSH